LGANPQAAAQKRQAARPAFRDLNLVPRAQAPSLLQGRVVNGTNGEPIANVRVTFTNRRFDPRAFTTDGLGRFEVKSLPEGDWLVEVEDAKGKGQPFDTITVSGGRVTDQDGRELSTLTLN